MNAILPSYSYSSSFFLISFLYFFSSYLFVITIFLTSLPATNIPVSPFHLPLLLSSTSFSFPLLSFFHLFPSSPIFSFPPPLLHHHLLPFSSEGLPQRGRERRSRRRRRNGRRRRRRRPCSPAGHSARRSRGEEGVRSRSLSPASQPFARRARPPSPAAPWALVPRLRRVLPSSGRPQSPAAPGRRGGTGGALGRARPASGGVRYAGKSDEATA